MATPVGRRAEPVDARAGQAEPRQRSRLRPVGRGHGERGDEATCAEAHDRELAPVVRVRAHHEHHAVGVGLGQLHFPERRRAVDAPRALDAAAADQRDARLVVLAEHDDVPRPRDRAPGSPASSCARAPSADAVLDRGHPLLRGELLHHRPRRADPDLGRRSACERHDPLQSALPRERAQQRRAAAGGLEHPEVAVRIDCEVGERPVHRERHRRTAPPRPASSASARWCTWSSSVTVPSAATANAPGPTGVDPGPALEPRLRRARRPSAPRARVATASRCAPNRCTPRSTSIAARSRGSSAAAPTPRPAAASCWCRSPGCAGRRSTRSRPARRRSHPAAVRRSAPRRPCDRAGAASARNGPAPPGARVDGARAVARVGGGVLRGRAVDVVAQRHRLAGNRDQRRYVRRVDQPRRVEARKRVGVAGRAPRRAEQQRAAEREPDRETGCSRKRGTEPRAPHKAHGVHPLLLSSTAGARRVRNRLLPSE